MKSRLFLLQIIIILLVNTSFAQHNNELYIQGELYLEPGAVLDVNGDMHLVTATCAVQNNGLIKIEGNLTKDTLSWYDANQTGLVKFENEEVNVGEDQSIEGDFTGINAFYDLEINNTATQPVVYQKNNHIEISNQLTLTNGRLRTSDMAGGTVYEVRITNPDPLAIAGDLNNHFISGDLVRSIQDFTSYYIPIGTDDPAMFGPQPFQLDLSNSPSTDLTIRFGLGSTTPIGTSTFCDSDQVIAYSPSGNVNMDCVAGQWEIDAAATGIDYDIEFFPSTELVETCNFLMHWLGKDGALTSACPSSNYAAYGLTDFSVFDIPGIAGPVLALDLVSFEAISGDNRIDIFWRTQSEVEFEGFELQKSLDGEHFETLTWVDGKGDPATSANYAFQDVNVQKNTIYYYRLKMLDIDGHFDYSAIRTAIFEELEHFAEARVFPNPINPNNQSLTYVALLDSEITLSLFNSIGQLVYNKNVTAVEGFNTLELPNLPMGPYHLLLQDEVYTRRGTILISY